MMTDYPTNTYIKCVLVGGEGHGQNHLKSPADANGFRIMKHPTRSAAFTSGSSSFEQPMYPDNTIWYEVFAEIWSRNEFIRLFRESPPYETEGSTSFIMIADAMRIAGIDLL